MLMLINRKFLYVGVFLIAIGGVLVVADVAVAEVAPIRDALQLWPLAIVAIGVGLALRRTPFSLPAGLLAAAIPGLVLGGGFALAPRIAADCGASGAPSSVTTEQGVFDGQARDLRGRRVRVARGEHRSGDAWRFEADNTTSRAPIVDASSRSLTIDARGRTGWQRARRWPVTTGD